MRRSENGITVALSTAGGRLFDRARKPTSRENPTMMESLVVIRTFENLLAADVAQLELLSSGIQSLLFSDETAPIEPTSGPAWEPIALAVHRRDAEVACAVLPRLTEVDQESRSDNFRRQSDLAAG
jgi:hypothetical protein